MAKVINNNRVVTNKALISYAHIASPAIPMNGGEPMYSCCLIIPKSDEETINAINEAVEWVYKNSSDKFGAKAPSFKTMHTPLRDGDDERPDNPLYANSYFINAKSKQKPRVVDMNKQDINDPEKIYSGMYANVILNFYAYSTSGNKGIGCGLGDMQKVADGQRLGGGVNADNAFDALGGSDGNDGLPF